MLRGGVALAACAVALVLGTSACSSAGGVDEAQLYAVGCPAVDTVAGGGDLASGAAVKLLEVARDSGQLDPQPEQYVDAAISVLKGTDAKDLPAGARTALVDGCADHGHPLTNL